MQTAQRVAVVARQREAVVESQCSHRCEQPETEAGANREVAHRNVPGGLEHGAGVDEPDGAELPEERKSNLLVEDQERVATLGCIEDRTAWPQTVLRVAPYGVGAARKEAFARINESPPRPVASPNRPAVARTTGPTLQW